MYDICDKTKWFRQVHKLIQDFDTWTLMVCIKKGGKGDVLGVLGGSGQ